jgi:3-methyladenine DNA glycosylase Tag
MAKLSDLLRIDDPEPVLCKMGSVMQQLDEEDLAALQAAFAAKVPSERISEALRRYGYTVSGPTIRRHVREGCGCPR